VGKSRGLSGIGDRWALESIPGLITKRTITLGLLRTSGTDGVGLNRSGTGLMRTRRRQRQIRLRPADSESQGNCTDHACQYFPEKS